MVEIINWIFKEKLGRFFILPGMFCLAAILSAFFLLSVSLILDLIALIMLTKGSALALRPGIRDILNPKVKVKERKKLDRNASIVAFAWLILGFSIILGKIIFLLLEVLSLKNIDFFKGAVLLPLGAWVTICIVIAFVFIDSQLNSLINER